MQTFSVTDTAMVGFKFIGSRPGVVLVWGLASVALALISTFTLTPAMLGPVQQMQALQGQGAGNPAAVVSAIGGMMGVFLLIFAISLIQYAVTFGATNRAILRPEDSAFAYLRLGGDELRLLALNIALGLIGGVAFFVYLIVASLLVGLVAGALFVMLHAFALIFAIPAWTVIICLPIFVLVRLSLAPAQTFATGRINLFGSWSLTRNHFWSMFGTYILMWILAVLVIVLVFLIATIITMPLPGGGFQAMFPTNPGAGFSAATLMSPARIVSTLVIAFANAALLPITLMPAPAIYRALTQGSVAETF